MPRGRNKAWQPPKKKLIIIIIIHLGALLGTCAIIIKIICRPRISRESVPLNKKCFLILNQAWMRSFCLPNSLFTLKKTFKINIKKTFEKIKLIFNHFCFFSLRYQRLKSTNSKDAENHLPGINDIFWKFDNGEWEVILYEILSTFNVHFGQYKISLSFCCCR